MSDHLSAVVLCILLTHLRGDQEQSGSLVWDKECGDFGADAIVSSCVNSTARGRAYLGRALGVWITGSLCQPCFGSLRNEKGEVKAESVSRTSAADLQIYSASTARPLAGQRLAATSCTCCVLGAG